MQCVRNEKGQIVDNRIKEGLKIKERKKEFP